MHMVGHQDIGMQLAILTLQSFSQPAQIGEAVLVIKKAGRAIVAALDDVQRHAVNVDALSPRHATSLAKSEPGPFLIADKCYSDPEY
jgi:hypothetical protein